MNKKLGPLPVWVWLGTAVAVAAVLYLRARNAAPVSAGTDQLGAGTDLSGALPATDGAATDPSLLTPTVPSEGDPIGTPSDPFGLQDPGTDILDPVAEPMPALVAALPAPIRKVVPKRKRAKHPGAKQHRRGSTRKTKAPGVRKGHRAPAHRHEHVHAPAPSHLRERPAHTRFNAPHHHRSSAPAHPHDHTHGSTPAPRGRPVPGSPGKVRLPARGPSRGSLKARTYPGPTATTAPPGRGHTAPPPPAHHHHKKHKK